MGTDVARTDVARTGVARIGVGRIGVGRIGVARTGGVRIGVGRIGGEDRRGEDRRAAPGDSRYALTFVKVPVLWRIGVLPFAFSRSRLPRSVYRGHGGFRSSRYFAIGGEWSGF